LKALLIYLNRFALLLKPFRLPLIAFTFLALLLTGYSLLVNSTFTLQALEPAIIATLWGMLLLASTELFQQIPDPVLPVDPFLQRLLSRCKLFLYSLLALTVLLVCAMLLWLSLRLLLI
tara:strand:- start:375 stop:731 length:357 start_codon:yes stop_codon:yes gene_type:complete